MAENMNDMLNSIISGDKDSFVDAFKSEMQDRIGSEIVNKNLEISKDILNTVSSDEKSDSIEEAKNNTTYTFKSPSDAKKFSSSAAKTPGLVGVNKRNFVVKGKSVTISGIKDKEMLQMLGMLATEMKAKVS